MCAHEDLTRTERPYPGSSALESDAAYFDAVCFQFSRVICKFREIPLLICQECKICRMILGHEAYVIDEQSQWSNFIILSVKIMFR